MPYLKQIVLLAEEAPQEPVLMLITLLLKILLHPDVFPQIIVWSNQAENARN